MHAIRQHQLGGPEVLVLEQLPDLTPAAGQVRIAVRAAGVHLLDTTLREGATGSPFPPPPLPYVPGREVAGVVDALGDGADAGWLGRHVVAHLGMTYGGYADQAVAAVEALIPLAEGTSPSLAVAMVGTGRTALGILAEAALTSADVVLVPAAAGGLGTLLVQAGRNAGATVIGLAGGPAKVALVEQLGADLALDCSAPGWPEQVAAWLGERRVTVVLDGVGGAVGRAAFDLLAPGGRIVMFGYTSGAATGLTGAELMARGLAASSALGPRVMARSGGIQALAIAAIAELEAGRLTPGITEFPLAAAPQAHTALTDRATTGKVVLVP
ncbi:MAG TPA: zinc-binding dehydrogenase [Ilumatobacter sp.]|nr:zinc-binding dehydrogenase [Ilumatobacter sp.]